MQFSSASCHFIPKKTVRSQTNSVLEELNPMLHLNRKSLLFFSLRKRFLRCSGSGLAASVSGPVTCCGDELGMCSAR
jgi:hypothetical protein